jgi:hypothetical protein
MNGSVLDSQYANDPYGMPSATQAFGSGQSNPYFDDAASLAAAGSGYYPSQATYASDTQPVSKPTWLLC